MDQLELHSYAKVNLALDVLGKREQDGYHDVHMIMIPISLSDRIRLEPAAEITVTMDPPLSVAVQENLAFRAAELLKAHTGYPGGAHIHIRKAIPVAGGLAGGSTNAATVLQGLNHLWGTGLSQQDLLSLAVRLGADVPFFILNRPARVEGIGEILTPVPVATPLWMVLATPDVSKSTGNVYRLYDALERVEHPDVSRMEAALASGSLSEISGALGNVFEQVMLPRHPEIAYLKRFMLENGAVGALMSGAGPTVFGLVESEEAGQVLAAQLQELARHVHLARMIAGGG